MVDLVGWLTGLLRCGDRMTEAIVNSGVDDSHSPSAKLSGDADRSNVCADQDGLHWLQCIRALSEREAGV